MDRQPELEALAQNFITSLGLEISMVVSEQDDSVRVELQGPDAPLLTDQEGAVLDALQLLMGKVAEAQLGLQKRLVVDCDGFRQSKESELVALAREVAQEVRETGQPLEIGPYNSYERRLIHLALKEEAGVTTESLGDGFSKRILIRLN